MIAQDFEALDISSADLQSTTPPTEHSENECHPLIDSDYERLRCGKCKGYLNYPPIMCFDGKDEYTECGRCYSAEEAEAAGLRAIRNHAVEVLAAETPFPCKNWKAGCTERHVWPQIERHEKECLHRTFACPLHILQHCVYQSSLQQLIEHFDKEHADSLLLDGCLTLDFTGSFENIYLVKQSNKVFNLHVKYDMAVNKAWFVVYLLEEGALDFTLEFVGDDLHSSFTTKQAAAFKAPAPINPKEAFEIDVSAIKLLLKNPKSIKCKVLLKIKLCTFNLKEIMHEIRCPVCWDFMKTKIYTCQNGHNVCSNCRHSLSKCPSCRETDIEIRNLPLEKIIAHALFPCENYFEGCTYVNNLEEVVYHSKKCPFATGN